MFIFLIRSLSLVFYNLVPEFTGSWPYEKALRVN